MERAVVIALWVLSIVLVVVAVDVLFFRHHLWPRLVANIAIVLAFGGLYLLVRRR